ncbi:MAG: type II toxin-antitoxin system RelE family toxin [Acidimicrobiales bacterium]
MNEPYELRVYGAARRALDERLPLRVARAVWEFCSGAFCADPHRVGAPLGRELAGYFSARRGAYRVIYRIDEEARLVHLVRIEHRADVVRQR